MAQDTNLMKDVEQIFYKTVQQKTSLMAVLDDPTEDTRIVGLALWVAYSRTDDILIRLEGEAARKFEGLQDALRKDINVFDKFDVDVHLEDFGSCVEPAFQGRQVALNLVLSGDDLAKELGIPAKTVTLSNLNMASVAQKEGLQVLSEIFYDDYRDEEGNLIVPVEEFKSVRYCGKKLHSERT